MLADICFAIFNNPTHKLTHTHRFSSSKRFIRMTTDFACIFSWDQLLFTDVTICINIRNAGLRKSKKKGNIFWTLFLFLNIYFYILNIYFYILNIYFWTYILNIYFYELKNILRFSYLKEVLFPFIVFLKNKILYL